MLRVVLLERVVLRQRHSLGAAVLARPGDAHRGVGVPAPERRVVGVRDGLVAAVELVNAGGANLEEDLREVLEALRDVR